MTSIVRSTRDLLGPVNQAVHVNNTTNGQFITINICNKNTFSISFSVAVSDSANDPSDSEWIEYGTVVPGKTTFERTQVLVGSGQFLVFRSSNSNVNAVCYGIGMGDPVESPITITTNIADGSSKAKAASSASAIKALTGTNTDGVYWIRAGVASPAQQIYCIMDSTWDGGGWMVVAHNSATTPVYSSSHKPRLTSNPNYVGSSGTNSYSPAYNFSVNVQDMPVTKLAWMAYTSGDWKNIVTYMHGTFNTARYIPRSTSWIRKFDNYHQELPWLTATDIRVRPAFSTVPIDDNTAFSVIALYNGKTGFGDYSAVHSYDPVTIMGRNANNASYPLIENDGNSYGVSGIFSWADRMVSGSEGINSINGWDDFQDGNSLGDTWGIPAAQNYGRGSPSYIMIK